MQIEHTCSNETWDQYWYQIETIWLQVDVLVTFEQSIRQYEL